MRKCCLWLRCLLLWSVRQTDGMRGSCETGGSAPTGIADSLGPRNWSLSSCGRYWCTNTPKRLAVAKQVVVYYSVGCVPDQTVQVVGDGMRLPVALLLWSTRWLTPLSTALGEKLAARRMRQVSKALRASWWRRHRRRLTLATGRRGRAFLDAGNVWATWGRKAGLELQAGKLGRSVQLDSR